MAARLAAIGWRAARSKSATVSRATPARAASAAWLRPSNARPARHISGVKDVFVDDVI